MEVNYGILVSFKMFFPVFIEMIDSLTSNCFFAIQSVVSINIKSPINKLLVLIAQTSSDSLIYFGYRCFDS